MTKLTSYVSRYWYSSPLFPPIDTKKFKHAGYETNSGHLVQCSTVGVGTISESGVAGTDSGGDVRSKDRSSTYTADGGAAYLFSWGMMKSAA